MCHNFFAGLARRHRNNCRYPYFFFKISNVNICIGRTSGYRDTRHTNDWRFIFTFRESRCFG